MAFLDPRAGHAQPRAVGQRELEEVSGWARIGDDGRIEAHRDNACTVDLDGFAVDLAA